MPEEDGYGQVDGGTEGRRDVSRSIPQLGIDRLGARRSNLAPKRDKSQSKRTLRKLSQSLRVRPLLDKRIASPPLGLSLAEMRSVTVVKMVVAAPSLMVSDPVGGSVSSLMAFLHRPPP